MRYTITKSGVFVNAIEADDLDFVKNLCTENGWDYTEDPLPEAPEPPQTEPSEEADMMQVLLDQEYRLTMLEIASGGTAEI